ncbi:unnamed protein product [Adineta steineri]|uniref:Apiosidase-like catalytic domain-containing protein n=1 Tax=Adineta steineri TaxID=433720 RepID=A0A813QIV2_9BILA|nr:unnamed protein product [Adineta steineri]
MPRLAYLLNRIESRVCRLNGIQPSRSLPRKPELRQSFADHVMYSSDQLPPKVDLRANMTSVEDQSKIASDDFGQDHWDNDDSVDYHYEEQDPDGNEEPNRVDYWLAQYNAIPARPILEDEANYEDIIPPYGGGTVTPKWKTRQSAWQSQIAGTFGFTYGAQGIWWGCYTVKI